MVESRSTSSVSRRNSWPPAYVTRSQVVFNNDRHHQVASSETLGPISASTKFLVVRGKVIPVEKYEPSCGDPEEKSLVDSDRRRRIASIFQHYYPEGGWGMILILVVIVVQILVHGLVLSYGVVLPKIFRRFQVSIQEAGTINCKRFRKQLNVLTSKMNSSCKKINFHMET